MRALIIETSTPHASIALATDGGIEQRSFHSDRSHNSQLFEPLTELLKERPELDLVLVGSGPGSYSGTRVGIAAAQGIAIAMGCPAVAVPSILAVPPADHGECCLAIGDARRGSYWTAGISDFSLLEKPSLCDEAELRRRIIECLEGNFRVFCFEDSSRLPLPQILSDQVSAEAPDATRLWQAWQGSSQRTRKSWAAQVPQPLYLKPPHITQAKRPWLL